MTCRISIIGPPSALAFQPFPFSLALEAPNLGIRGVGMSAGVLGGGLEEVGYVRVCHRKVACQLHGRNLE